MKAMELRYERKFVITGEGKYEIESVVKRHKAFFSEIFQERTVNNIYLDTIDLKHYWTHMEGKDSRLKVRLRWYGEEQDYIKPVLELKIRRGNVGFKIVHPMSKVPVSGMIGRGWLSAALEKDRLSIVDGVDLKALRPVLYNSYRRSYWLASDRRLRLTIDGRVHYANLMTGEVDSLLSGAKAEETMVVELKYERNYEVVARAAGLAFPWRQSRNSKYVMGMEALV